MSATFKEVRAFVFEAALKVDCALCRQAAGRPCVSRVARYVLKKPHDRRIDAAREAGHWSLR